MRKALDAAIAGQGLIEPVDIAFEGDKERSGRVYLSPVERAEGESEAAIAYAIDTTEQRALEMQIAQSQKMQAIGQLAGGIAHDFNNMLTAIIGFSDFLLMNHRPTDPAFQDIMNIKQNANRAAGLVRQLLAFSRQQTLRPERLQLGDVLSELSILLGRLLGENIELKLDSGSDIWPVKADLHQFEQVIINLAVNARDAMPNGGKLVIRTANVGERDSLELGQHRVPPGEYVLIEVSDTGTGMAPEVMQKMFEPFFSTKEVGRGTGLGLSTVYGIVKQTGGHIIPDSELGRGTVMRVYLPRYVEVAGEAEPARAPAPVRREQPKDLTGRGTVLLVEDEDAVRSFAARALGQRGYHVLEATTGTEALEMFTSYNGDVDLVVSDVVMPEMDGPTLMKHLRSERPDVKIIFISGYAEDAFRRNLSDKEDFMFLQKPFDLEGARRGGEGGVAGLTAPPARHAANEREQKSSFRRRSRLTPLQNLVAAFGGSPRVPDYEKQPDDEHEGFRRRARAKPRMPALTIHRYGGRLIYFWFGMRFRALLKLFKRGHYSFTLNCIPDVLALFLWVPWNSVLYRISEAKYRRAAEALPLDQPPVFVIGHWRTGTTFLHDLFSVDPNLAYPTTFECFFPHHFLLTENTLPKIMKVLLPKKRPQDDVPVGFDRPQEEEFGMLMLGEGTPYLTHAWPRFGPADSDYLDFKGLSEADKKKWADAYMWFYRRLVA